MPKQAKAGLRINDDLRRSARPRLCRTPCAWRGRYPALLQRLDKEQDFRGHLYCKSGAFREGAVAAAGDDGLEGGSKPRLLVLVRMFRGIQR